MHKRLMPKLGSFHRCQGLFAEIKVRGKGHEMKESSLYTNNITNITSRKCLQVNILYYQTVPGQAGGGNSAG